MTRSLIRVGSRRERDAATELLTLCLRDVELDPDRARRLIAQSSTDAVVELAAYHGVASMIYQPLRALGAGPAELIAELRDHYAASVHAHLRVTWELARLKPVLDASGARWAVIKGPAAVELLYRGSGRPYRDLDLLVDPGQFRGVLAALESSGYRLLDRNWRALRRDLRGEVHLLGRSGIPLDLHWNVVNMYRGKIRISTDHLLRRAAPVELAGVAVHTLEPTDSLTHLALHAAISGGDRLMWLKDIERSVVLRPPDWPELIRRARGGNVAAPVGLMLARAAEVLAARVPGSVVDELLHRRTLQVVRLVDRVFPWERALGRLAAPSRLLARSIGRGPLGALLWIGWRSIRNLDPREPAASSAFTPRGDERDREAFLESVVASAAESWPSY
jgi:hypothetical protein